MADDGHLGCRPPIVELEAALAGTFQEIEDYLGRDRSDLSAAARAQLAREAIGHWERTAELPETASGQAAPLRALLRRRHDIAAQLWGIQAERPLPARDPAEELGPAERQLLGLLRRQDATSFTVSISLEGGTWICRLENPDGGPCGQGSGASFEEAWRDIGSPRHPGSGPAR